MTRISTNNIRRAWHHLRRLWKPIAWWTLLSWLLVGVVMVPLTSALLGTMVFRGDRIMIGHEELIGWLLTPSGFGYVLVASGLAVIGAVFRYAGIFHIFTNDMKGEAVPVHHLLLKLLPDLPSLFRLCITSAAIVLLLLLPLLAGLGIIYLVWLSEHDINYYYYTQPSEWYYALIIGGTWTFLWGMALFYLILRSLNALPAFLDGHRPFRTALKQGWQTTNGGSAALFRILLLLVLLWLLLRTATQALLFSLSALLIENVLSTTESLTALLVVTGGYGLFSFLLDLLISFIGFSLTALVLTQWYYEKTGLHHNAPPVPLGLARLPARTARMARNWLRPRRGVPLLLALLLAGSAATGWLWQQIPDEHSFTVTAHRAGAFLGPENTLVALERTIETGAEYAEIDVQSTRDGEVVVVHDADLMRVAGKPIEVASATYSEIADLLQSSDNSIPEEERRIATLDEFLERAKGRIKLNIEPKYYGPDPELADRILDRVEAHDMKDQVIIMSFKMEPIHRISRRAPEITTGYLTAMGLGEPFRLPVDFLAVPRPLAGEAFIRNAHRNSMEVHVWTINSLSGMLEVARLGADSIITDAPDVAVQLRNELHALTPAERLLLSFRPSLEVLENM